MKPFTRTRDLVKFGKWVGLALVIAAASCVQVLDGAYDYQPMCTIDIDCDDANPCSIDECLADNTCLHTASPNGLLPIQTVADCKRDECLEGEVFLTNDDADIADDSELCTTDSCSDGSPTHTPAVDGTSCVLSEATGICSMGICAVKCSADTQCKDGNPCTDDSCNVGIGACTFTALEGIPTPGYQEPVGDCKLHICANGMDVALDDDADVPDDLNSCTQDVCIGGVGSNPGVSTGTPCVMGEPDVCDGQGACVQCNVAADCVLLPTDDECQQRVCTNNVCGQTFAPVGTAGSMQLQTLGDCKRVVCNGFGGTITENFDTDLPEDNNPCTQDICISGSPSNPSEMPGFVCGNGFVCNQVGLCTGCLAASVCPGMDDFCKARTCISQECGYNYTPVGTNLPIGQTALDCKVLECDGSGNIVTSVDIADKPVDGNQCTQDICNGQGVPSNPFEAVNTPCSQNGGTACNGAGACKKTLGATCVAAGDCLTGFCVDGVCCNSMCGMTCRSCNVPGSVGTCVNVPKAGEDAPGCTGANSCDGTGTCKKDDAQGCASATECVSNFCADGVCCSTACTTACRACNMIGAVGTCTNITSGDDNFPANVCTATNTCDSSGTCKLKNSQSCLLGTQCASGQCFDGVCCNVTCGGTCKSCNIAGLVGICSNVASGQDDINGVPSCSGSSQSCDGAGVCKKEIAQGCVGNAECLSGFCIDDVCCNSACTATCQSCNLSGSLGTCSNVVAGQDDVGTCSGTTQSCDGTGACKSELGTLCSNGANCLSGFCVDGYCCNTACMGTCLACSAAIKASGVDGVCGFISAGTDPENECLNVLVCDGAGMCI